MERDHREIVNLAADPRHSAVVGELRERLLRWMVETGDMLPEQRDGRGW